MKLYQNKDWLEKKVKKGLSDYEMSLEANCCESTIEHRRHNFKVYRRKKVKGTIIYQPKELLTRTETVTAFVTGFCEGDGCIAIAKYKRRRSSRYCYKLDIIFSQSEKRKIILDSIQHYFGGFQYYYPKIYQWVLRIGQKQSATLLELMESHSVGKLNQVKIGLLFMELKKLKKGLYYETRDSEEILRQMENCKQELHKLHGNQGPKQLGTNIK